MRQPGLAVHLASGDGRAWARVGESEGRGREGHGSAAGERTGGGPQTHEGRAAPLVATNPRWKDALRGDDGRDGAGALGLAYRLH